MNNTAPRAASHQRKGHGARFTRGWTGLWISLEGRERFHPTGFRSPDRPPPSESLKRQRYPDPLNSDTVTDIQIIPYWIKSTCCFLPSHARCAMAIVFDCRASMAKSGVPFQARHCDTCGRQSGNGTGFFVSAFASPVSITPPLLHTHSTVCPHVTEALT